MARTKRRENPLNPASESPQPESRIYKACGYCRLSVQDSGKPGTDTIVMQNKLIREYIEAQPDMEFVAMYSDNGWTGTNFERPEFQRMMQDLKQGKIDCIVVKDLSRFGRNYRETGDYLDNIFPFMSVRFIAVQDNFDTLTAERNSNGYVVYLKNILNDVYAKDISRKTCPALAMKQKRGEFIGDWAAYGYRRCADDYHRIEPDENTAPIVQNIFQWRVSGMAYGQIARRLTEQGIPTPSQYLHQQGLITTDRYDNSAWGPSIVKKILTSEVYIGCMVQGRKRSALSEGIKQREVPKSEWVVVENTHEPLIDRDIFNKVQEMAEAAAGRYQSRLGCYDELEATPNILKGLVYCADCKHPMVRYKGRIVTKAGTRLYYTFICPTHAKNPKLCPNISYKETDLKTGVWQAVQAEIAQSETMKEQIAEYERSKAAADRDNAFDAEIGAARKSLNRATRLYDSLYQSYVDKLISEQEYTSMRERYRKDMEAAQGRLDAIEKRREEEHQRTGKNPWMASFGSFHNCTELTADMAHELIDRIEIDANKHVTITLRHQQEHQALAQRLAENGEAVTV